MTKLPAGIKLRAYVAGKGIVDYSDYDGIDLTISSSSPGGYDQASFTICNPNNDIPTLFSKVWVQDDNNSQIVWLGRVLDVDASYPSGPVVINCVGYQDALEDQGFSFNNVYIYGLPIETVITHAFTQLCPELTGGSSINAGGTAIAEDTRDYLLATCKDVIEDMAALLSGLSTPLMYHVWGDDFIPLSTAPKLFVNFQDPVARYRILLDSNGKSVTMHSRYSSHAIINQVLVQWGNQQVVMSGSNPVNYTVIPIIREKRLNIENDAHVSNVASILGDQFIARFGSLRSVSDIVTVCAGSPLTAIPPVSILIDDTYPLWLVRAGYGIGIQNIDGSKFRPYTDNVKFIIGTRYSFITGTLEIACGEVTGLGTTIRNIQAAIGSRAYQSSRFSAQSYAMADNDLLPTFGPAFHGASGIDNNLTGGIPVFVKDKNGLEFNAVVHPGLIVDEGLEANMVIGDLSSGPKGGIKTIPGLYSSWDAFFDNDNTTDSITVKVFKKAATPVTSLLQPIVEVKIASNTRGSGTFAPVVMGRGDRFFFEVIDEPTSATICSISIRAPKVLHPGLKL